MQTSPSDLLRYQSTKTTQPLKDSLECSISVESTEGTPFVHEAAIAFSNFLKQDGETVSQTKKCRSQEKTENMLMRSQAQADRGSQQGQKEGGFGHSINHYDCFILSPSHNSELITYPDLEEQAGYSFYFMILILKTHSRALNSEAVRIILPMIDPKRSVLVPTK